MSGINAFFHIGSAVAFVLLVYLLLRTRRALELLRSLVKERQQTAGVARVHVAAPAQFLETFAEALGIAFEGQGSRGAPARITAAPLLDLFFRHGLFLIRCRDTEIEMHVRTGSAPAAPAAQELEQALGGQVHVRIIGAHSQGVAHVTS